MRNAISSTYTLLNSNNPPEVVEVKLRMFRDFFTHSKLTP